jgi:hypothetical protein
MSAEMELYGLAAQQRGAFARWQALALGLTRAFVNQRVRTGAWVVVAPGVYSLPGVADSWARRLWVAHLAVGLASIVSHESAAELHGFEGVLRNQVVLTVPHPHQHRVTGAFVHQLTDVRPEWVTTIDGLPVTVPARTIVDLAAVLRPLRLQHCAHHAAIARTVSLDEVAVCLGQLARRGKPGVRKLGVVLDHLGPGQEIAASELEALFFPVLERGGLPAPRRQFAHPGRVITNGCVDCAYVDAMLIIEVDGRRWHSRINDIKRDRERDNAAARAGYQTLRFLHEHVRSDPDGVCATVRDVRELRMAA